MPVVAAMRAQIQRIVGSDKLTPPRMHHRLRRLRQRPLRDNQCIHNQSTSSGGLSKSRYRIYGVHHILWNRRVPPTLDTRYRMQ